MRIIAGRKRGLRLASVGKGDMAAHLRPTADRVRENIFNLLMGGAYGDPISGARVLDLFAGAGALGLEAWSRGATQVTFVDDGRIAQSLIQKNIDICNAKCETKILRQNAVRLGENQNQPFDLVFLDPPYGKGLGEKSLKMALRGDWLANNALIVFEEGQPLPPSPGFRMLDQRRYGDTHLRFLELESQT